MCAFVVSKPQSGVICITETCENGEKNRNLFAFSLDSDADRAMALVNALHEAKFFTPVPAPAKLVPTKNFTLIADRPNFKIIVNDLSQSFSCNDDYCAAYFLLRKAHAFVSCVATPAPARAAAFVVVYNGRECCAFATRKQAEDFVWTKMSESRISGWMRKMDVTTKTYLDQWTVSTGLQTLQILPVESFVCDDVQNTE